MKCVHQCQNKSTRLKKRVIVNRVKWVLGWHDMKGHSDKKKPVLQQQVRKPNDSKKRCKVLETCHVVWWTYIKVFCHNDYCEIWRKKRDICKLEVNIPIVKNGSGSSMCGCWTGGLHELNGSMRKRTSCDKIEATSQNFSYEVKAFKCFKRLKQLEMFQRLNKDQSITCNHTTWTGMQWSW